MWYTACRVGRGTERCTTTKLPTTTKCRSVSTTSSLTWRSSTRDGRWARSRAADSAAWFRRITSRQSERRTKPPPYSPRRYVSTGPDLDVGRGVLKLLLWKGLWLITACRLLDPFQRYSRSKRRVVRNRSHCTVDFGWVNIRQLNFVVSGSKFTSFVFFQRGRGCSWSLAFQIFDISIRFGDLSRSKSKVFRNRVDFCNFFALPTFWGACPKNVYPNFYPCRAAYYVDKFGEVFLPDPMPKMHRIFGQFSNVRELCTFCTTDYSYCPSSVPCTCRVYSGSTQQLGAPSRAVPVSTIKQLIRNLFNFVSSRTGILGGALAEIAFGAF